MRTPESVFSTIQALTGEVPTYGAALDALKSHPEGYALCFSFHYVDADILNGGISQLYSNSTWALVPTAIRACQHASCPRLELLLREIIYYYHQKGRSKLKRQLTENYFDTLVKPMNKSLAQLDDEYFSLDVERDVVVRKLVSSSDRELWGVA